MPFFAVCLFYEYFCAASHQPITLCIFSFAIFVYPNKILFKFYAMLCSVFINSFCDFPPFVSPSASLPMLPTTKMFSTHLLEHISFVVDKFLVFILAHRTFVCLLIFLLIFFHFSFDIFVYFVLESILKLFNI